MPCPRVVPMIATTELPDDPALPALAAIRAEGPGSVLPALGLDHSAVELVVRGYTPGSRATLDVRAGDRRVAIKVYAEDPAPEAELYQTLAASGLGGPGHPSGARVPPLLAWDRDLRVLALGWLEGLTAEDLVKNGRGERAGELGARWIRGVASLPVKLGRPVGATYILAKAGKWVATLSAADPVLGAAAQALAETLALIQPDESGGGTHLVHGTLYGRHVFDLGDGPGVIDWHRFGHGPLELDAGVFLATVSRLGLRDRAWAEAAARAEQAFLDGTGDLLNERALAWHRAAASLHLARRSLKRRPVSEARAVLSDAGRIARGAE